MSVQRLRMSVLQTYLNWANSVLADTGINISGLAALQDGKVLCDIIDVLDPKAGLIDKVKDSGDASSLVYVNTALDHMKSHGVQIKFRAEDILKGDVKSILDVLWSLILNYGIHHIGTGQPAQQRSIGRGKKILLEWCQQILGTTFDPSDTLTFSLCRNGWFLPLLEKVTQHTGNTSQDKVEHLENLMKVVQDRFLIQADIIQPRDVLDGTADEHSLMIFLSLLKRRVDQQSLTGQKSLETDDPRRAIEDDNKPQTDRTPKNMENLRDDHWTQQQQQQPSTAKYLTSLRDWQDSYTLSDDRISPKISSNLHLHTLPSTEAKSINPNYQLPQWRDEYKRNHPHGGNPFLRQEHAMNDNSKLPRNLVLENTRFLLPEFKDSRNVGQDKTTQTTPTPLSALNQQGLRPSNKVHKYWGRVEITRPRDYIDQWEEVMDRLSSGSFADQSGEVWSNSLNNISSVRRWRSVDACKAHRSKLKTTSIHPRPDGIYRSKSSSSLSSLPLSEASTHGRGSSRERVDSRQNTDWIERRPSRNMTNDNLISSHAGTISLHSSPAFSSIYPGIKSNLRSQTDFKLNKFLSYSPAVLNFDKNLSGLSISSRCTSTANRSPTHRSRSVGSRSNGNTRRLRFLSPTESISPDNQSELGYRSSPVPFSSRSRALTSHNHHPGLRKKIYDRHFNSELNARDQNGLSRELSPKGRGRVPRKEAWERGHGHRGPVAHRATGRKLQSDATRNYSQETDTLHQGTLEESEDMNILSESLNDKHKLNRLDSNSHVSNRDSSFNQMLLSQQIELLNNVTDERKSCPLLYRVDSPTSKILSTTSTDGVMPSMSSENQNLSVHLDYAQGNSPNITDSDSFLFDTYDNSDSNFEPICMKYSLRLNKTQINKLISKANLTDLEVGRLKEAVATSEVENEILESKLRRGREEICQKFRHVHGVLDDCRRHLARTQEENMELRTSLRQERGRSQEGGRRVEELEMDFSEAATENQLLQNELFLKQQLMERAAIRAGVVVDDLRADRSMLADGVAELQDDNQQLREEVSSLERLHSAAVSTIETLRTSLAQIRAEGARRLNEATRSPELSSDLTRGTTKDFRNQDSTFRQSRRQSSPLSNDGSGFVVPDEAYYSSVEDVDRGGQKISSPWWHEETSCSFDNQRIFEDCKELLQKGVDSIDDEVPPYNEHFNFSKEVWNNRKARHGHTNNDEFRKVNYDNFSTRDLPFQSTERSLSSIARAFPANNSSQIFNKTSSLSVSSKEYNNNNNNWQSFNNQRGGSTRAISQPYLFKTTEEQEKYVGATDKWNSTHMYDIRNFQSKEFNQPVLSEADRIWADQLVQKYTGSLAAGGHYGLLVV